MKTLNRNFFRRNPEIVARELLGKLLVRDIDGEILIGKIVETEAYLAKDDLAAHSYRGKTKSNASIFLDGGHSYVYSIHSYYCLDAVCETQGMGGCVLIRGIEPIEGIDKMKILRGKDNVKDLTTGPGKICMALKIDKSLDGIDLTDKNSVLKISSPDANEDFDIAVSKRIGISKSKDLNLRFTILGSKFLSK